MEDPGREQLRATFGSVAEQYDRARPTYPDGVFDDLVELSALPVGARVVEIGPGTGKATVELARRGLAVVGVELSSALAEVARRNLAPFPRARVVTADFETWRPEEAGFAAVAAFSAFHWIAPELRYTRPAELLRPGGALAVLHNHHVTPDDADPVWVEVQEDYDAIRPAPDNRPPPHPDEAPDLSEEMEASGLFADVEVRRRRWDVTYTADEWIALLGTYSGNLALPEPERAELFRRIHERIASRPGGTATRHYLAALTVGRTC